MSWNIDIICIVIVLFIYNIKTLVRYQVTNDHGLSCLHTLNTNIVQTRLVDVRTTQKWLHNSTCTTLTQQLQPHPVGWTKTRLTTSGYATHRSQMNPVSHFIFPMGMYHPETSHYILLPSKCL